MGASPSLVKNGCGQLHRSQLILKSLVPTVMLRDILDGVTKDQLLQQHRTPAASMDVASVWRQLWAVMCGLPPQRSTDGHQRS